MELLEVRQAGKLQGTISVPGDKSISHRVAILASIANGTTMVRNFSTAKDCLATLKCLRQLGVSIRCGQNRMEVDGRGLDGLREPDDILDAENSGTTFRLLTGLLAGQDFTTILTGDSSLRRRPMARITEPLRQMGAIILGRGGGKYPPLAVCGGRLNPIQHSTLVASAQVKSALLLAGLYADGETIIDEPAQSRNHTELMLRSFGVSVEIANTTYRIKGGSSLKACDFFVPGDLSSAAFLMVAAIVTPDSQVTIEQVGLNPTRLGVIEVLRQMGASITIENICYSGNEPYGDIKVVSSQLQGTVISGDLIPQVIDEIPILAVAAACAQGTTEIRDAQELRVKESDRLQALCAELSKFGVEVTEYSDGLRVTGTKDIRGTTCSSYGDHRIAMALTVLGGVASGKTSIKDSGVINVSFPEFPKLYQTIGGEVKCRKSS